MCALSCVCVRACSPGHFCPNGTAVPCPVGRYNAASGASDPGACVPCAAGRYSTLEGRDSDSWCLACPQHEGSLEGASVCWPGLMGEPCPCMPATRNPCPCRGRCWARGGGGVVVRAAEGAHVFPQGRPSSHVPPCSRSSVAAPPLLPHGCPAAWARAGVFASDKEPLLPGLSVDDSLTLYFTKPTNTPDVGTPEALWALVGVQPNLAGQLSAAWVSVRRVHALWSPRGPCTSSALGAGGGGLRWVLSLANPCTC
jgi:hypothetical protein